MPAAQQPPVSNVTTSTSSDDAAGSLHRSLQALADLGQPHHALPGVLNFPPFNLPPLRRPLLALINRLTARQRQAVVATAQLLEASLQHQQAGQQQCQHQLQQLQQQLDTQQAVQEQQQSRHSRLADRVAGLALSQRVSSPSDAVAPAVTSPLAGNADFDQFYAAFETAFRGDPQLIALRQADYLPLLKAALPSGKPILDIGCGRGEWLQLLGQQGWQATGWDINARFIEDNRASGLDVHHGDALAELARIARQAPGSLGAITAFHVIEHIPFAALLSLVDHALIALAEGGVIIFETPNPENLIVGANTFYTDPTHERPLHPATLAFMAERAGFAQAQAWRLLTARGIQALGYPADPGLAPLVDLLNQHLACGPDFALVARKGQMLPPGVQP